MGYRGKWQERERARELRAQAWTLEEIAQELGVSKSSASIWTRDVEFTPKPPKRTARSNNGPTVLQQRRLAQIAELNEEGRRRIGALSDREFLVAGVALYAGEGAKTDGAVKFANTNADIIAFFCAWLRRFFDIDELRLRGRLYLHQGLDLTAANEFWSQVSGIPVDQFGKPYRAKPDGGIRNSKHEFGCFTVSYCCSMTHRRIMGLLRALLEPPTAGVGTAVTGHGRCEQLTIPTRPVP